MQEASRRAVGATTGESYLLGELCDALMRNQWIIPILQLQETPRFAFPESDLMNSLIELFFENSIRYLPILHRGTFQQQLKSGLHFTDEGFASVVLLVCSLGARFSDDTRVLLGDTDSWYSAGWKWFSQVQKNHKLVNLRPPRLFDLQICAVSCFSAA